MKLPRNIGIGGRKIRVCYAELAHFGEFDYDEGVIRIANAIKNNPKEVYETFRHELVEAALLLGGVGWQEIYDQEPVVRALDNIFWPAWEKIRPKLDAQLPKKA